MKPSQKKNQKKIPAKKVVKKVEVKKPTPAKVAPIEKVAAPVMPVIKKSSFKVQPLGDRVIIKEDAQSIEQTTASGIIIPMTVEQDKSGKRGKVMAVGNGRYEKGEHVPVSVNEGDLVLFQWGDKITVDNQEYYIVRESEILAVINN